jgi:hypothetical protein
MQGGDFDFTHIVLIHNANNIIVILSMPLLWKHHAPMIRL